MLMKDIDMDVIISLMLVIYTGEVYLDHAGATLYARQQVKHFSDDLLSNVYGNPHSGSSSSRLTADLIQQTRYRYLEHQII